MSTVPIKPLIRGHIDLFQRCGNGQARMRGWIFRADTPIDKIDITLLEKPWVSDVSLHERPDVRTVYQPHIGDCAHAAQSGFDITAPLPPGVEAGPRSIIDLMPYMPRGSRLDPLRTYFCAYDEELKELPQPPAHL